MSTRDAVVTCLCGGQRYEEIFSYHRPPPGETSYQLGNGPYGRRILRCLTCGHMRADHQLDFSSLYEQTYVNGAYGDQQGIRSAFERIMALPSHRSDNVQRVSRVSSHARKHFGNIPQAETLLSVLDVGSGLGVFLKGMKAAGFICTALDPDIRFVRHSAEYVGVEAIHADFLKDTVERTFDIVTFNKVLEHVLDPVSMLQKSLGVVKPEGMVYVEVPDGEIAVKHGAEREEFFIEHFHVFSAASLALLASRSGFTIKQLERLREPSSKFTLWALLSPSK